MDNPRFRPDAEAPRIMVTGASGFVGRYLVEALVRRLPQGGRVLACSRDEGRTAWPDVVEPVRLDLTDAGQMDEAVRRLMPSHIVHLAGVSTLAAAAADPDKTWQINLFGTLRLAEALARHRPGGCFVFVGSSEVYGRSFQGGRAVDETALPDPTNLYSSTKIAADLALGQMASDRLRVVRARPFNHIGPGQREDYAVSAFAAQIARIERGLQPPVMRVGNLESERDFLDVRDVVDAYCRIVERSSQLPNGGVLNIASGVPRRIRSVLDELLTLARIPIEVTTDPTRMRPSDTPLVLGDASRARDLLGWAPAQPWMDTIADILEYWRRRVSGAEPVAASFPSTPLPGTR